MGMKHCGKSSFGRKIAARRSLPFYDLDDIILESIRADGYDSVRALYRSAGKEKFQEREKEAAERLAGILRTSPLVAALGGGTVENGPAMSSIAPLGTLVYLEVEEEELFRRIRTSGIPPFLEGENPPEVLFHRLYLRRTALYEKWADNKVALPPAALEENFERLYATIYGGV